MKLPRSLQRLKKPDADNQESVKDTDVLNPPYISTPVKKPVKELRISRWPFVIRRVQGHSMVPVLPPGTTVLGWRWFQDLKTGDVIIFLHDGKEKIKRLSDVRADEVFVLGDHPESSTDSRHFGWIPRDSIVATVFWPHAPKDRAEVSS